MSAIFSQSHWVKIGGPIDRQWEWVMACCPIITNPLLDPKFILLVDHILRNKFWSCFHWNEEISINKMRLTCSFYRIWSQKHYMYRSPARCDVFLWGHSLMYIYNILHLLLHVNYVISHSQSHSHQRAISISDKMSYCNIFLSLEAARLIV